MAIQKFLHPIIFIIFFSPFSSGDPQEECVRCGKVYLSSSNQISHGFCGGCYAANQGLPLTKESENRSLHDSGSEDSNPQEGEEEEEEEEEME